MAGFIFLLVVVALVYLGIRFLRRNSWKRHGNWPKFPKQYAKEDLEKYGSDHERRAVVINSVFESETATLRAVGYASWNRTDQLKNVSRVAYTSDRTTKVKSKIVFLVTRNLVDIDNRERNFLRVAELLNSAANGKDEDFIGWKLALLWGDGKGVIARYATKHLEPGDRADPVNVAVQRLGLSVDRTVNAMLQYAFSASERRDIPQSYRAILSELSAAAAPAGGGSWLKASDIPGSPFADRSSYSLHLGSLAEGSPLSFSGDGSMVTIAPPGSGKTQCHVFPNLLTWPGPAVVLDVSGEIYENTAGWRARNVGPVYKFNPLEPEASHHYNPLTFVRSEPDFVWDDSRLLAEMMIVPSSSSSDPFWENEARTVLTSAIANVCYANKPDNRPMNSVLDVLFGGEAWDDMIRGLQRAVDVRVMKQHATSLSEMNEKTRSSVLQVARSSLTAWTGERIARATMRSDWSPEDLRQRPAPTLYICVRPNEVEAYLSLLRVFIGQHIRLLTSGYVPPIDAQPILFMLDELPRLRNMPPIDEALNIGRKYGIRLWMFAQSVGQFQTEYPNADGMLGACAVRIYMNPSGADGLADRLSDELGYVDSFHDNSRTKLVEATELSGPEYRDKEIVLAVGSKPAKVSKDFCYLSPELKERAGIPPEPVSGR